MRRMTRTRMYLMTAIAVALYAGMGVAFGDGYFTGPFLVASTWAESSALSWLLLGAIVAGGIFQARRIPAGASGLAIAAGAGGPLSPRLLAGSRQFAVLWLPLRFFVGREWLASGEQKLRDAGWMDGGSSLQGYWQNAVAIPAEGRPAITYDWFRTFLQYMLDHEWYTWFGKLIAVGEFLVGVGLIVGALVGIAAFFGSLMNFNFMLAGASSANPVLFALGILLVLGWRVAGYLGLDRVLLRGLAPVRSAAKPVAPSFDGTRGGSAPSRAPTPSRNLRASRF